MEGLPEENVLSEGELEVLLLHCTDVEGKREAEVDTLFPEVTEGLSGV